MRSFAKKKKGSKKDDEAASTEAEEDVVEEPVVAEEPVVKAAPATPSPPKADIPADFAAATKNQEAQSVDKSLFGAFSVGDVKQVQSTEGNKAPFRDDSVPGRYAEVLFTTASS
jgi:hypothetical protein